MNYLIEITRWNTSLVSLMLSLCYNLLVESLNANDAKINDKMSELIFVSTPGLRIISTKIEI